MSVGHFESQHSLTYLHAWESGLDGDGNLLGEQLEASQYIVLHVEDIVYLAARNDQRVALDERIDVKKSVVFVVFGNFVARNFTCYYS